MQTIENNVNLTESDETSSYFVGAVFKSIENFFWLLFDLTDKTRNFPNDFDKKQAVL